MFNEKLSDGEFNIYHIDSDNVDENNNLPFFDYAGNRNINIPLTHTLEDIYNIIHELFHSLNYSNISNPTRNKFTEFISILSEFLVGSYLENAGIDESSFELNNRLFQLYIDALNTLILNEVINYLGKNDTLNYNRFYDTFMEKYPNANFLPERISSVLNSSGFFTLASAKYVIGTIFSLELIETLNINEVISKIILINDNINNYEDKDIYSLLGLTLEARNNKILFTKSDFDKLSKCYVNTCDKSLKKIYCKLRW